MYFTRKANSTNSDIHTTLFDLDNACTKIKTKQKNLHNLRFKIVSW